MVYKKYIKKRGKVFGPYYYRSYRDGNSVKKIYIGGEKAYKEYLKKQKSSKVKKDSYFRKKKVEQPVKPLRSLKKRNKIARGLFLLLFMETIMLEYYILSRMEFIITMKILIHYQWLSIVIYGKKYPVNRGIMD